MDYYIYNNIKDIVKDKADNTINQFLSDKVYHPSDNEYFIDKVNEMLINQLTEISKNFKYIVDTLFFKDDSISISQGVNGIFNSETDGVYVNTYVFDRIGCIVTIFIIAI
jgi:hypothetical protein